MPEPSQPGDSRVDWSCCCWTWNGLKKFPRARTWLVRLKIAADWRRGVKATILNYYTHVRDNIEIEYV